MLSVKSTSTGSVKGWGHWRVCVMDRTISDIHYKQMTHPYFHPFFNSAYQPSILVRWTFFLFQLVAPVMSWNLKSSTIKVLILFTYYKSLIFVQLNTIHFIDRSPTFLVHMIPTEKFHLEKPLLLSVSVYSGGRQCIRRPCFMGLLWRSWDWADTLPD